MKKTVYRLLADYECHAVWERRADGGLENLDPEQMGLTAPLATALRQWAEVFDSTLNRQDPAASGFSTDLEGELFARWGRSLGESLCRELGEPVEFLDYFFPDPIILSP